jgi:hypothetical protein
MFFKENKKWLKILPFTSSPMNLLIPDSLLTNPTKYFGNTIPKRVFLNWTIYKQIFVKG